MNNRNEQPNVQEQKISNFIKCLCAVYCPFYWLPLTEWVNGFCVPHVTALSHRIIFLFAVQKRFRHHNSCATATRARHTYTDTLHCCVRPEPELQCSNICGKYILQSTNERRILHKTPYTHTHSTHTQCVFHSFVHCLNSPFPYEWHWQSISTKDYWDDA